MLKNVKIKKNSNKIYFDFAVIFLVALITLQQTDFFRNSYFLMKRNYEERLIRSYEYCGKESIGFLAHMKKKYNITYKVPILNFDTSPNSSWYYSSLKYAETNKVIFLNYDLYNRNLYKNINDEFSYYLESYNVIHQFRNCYLLEKK